MDSSLLMLGLVGLWLAVLVPQWIRRRDAMGASRSADRFSLAMRVLARRPEHELRPHDLLRRPTILASPRLDLLGSVPVLSPAAVRVVPPPTPARVRVAVLLAASVTGAAALGVAVATGLVGPWLAVVGAAQLPVVVLAVVLRARRLAVRRRADVRRRALALRDARRRVAPGGPSAEPARVLVGAGPAVRRSA